MEHELTFGAHLLLWVFPLVLTCGVVAAALIEGRRKGDPR